MPEHLMPLADVLEGLRRTWGVLILGGITPGTYKAREAHLYASAIAHLQRLAEIDVALAEPSIPPAPQEEA